MKIANMMYFLPSCKQVPIVPYGGATSIEGHTLAPHGGVCIDMSLMKVFSCFFFFINFVYHLWKVHFRYVMMSTTF